MQPTEKVTISMPPDMLRTVRESVEAGEYASTSEAMRDAVRVWQRQRQEDAERLSAIKSRIRRSLDDPRPSITSADVDANLNALFTKAREDAERA